MSAVLTGSLSDPRLNSLHRRDRAEKKNEDSEV